MTTIQTVDRELFHQMMRRLARSTPPEEIPDSMRLEIRDVAARLMNATAAKVGGTISIDTGVSP
jgi:hypothetical protein